MDSLKKSGRWLKGGGGGLNFAGGEESNSQFERKRIYKHV